MDASPELSVVIPAHNESAVLARCLDTLLAGASHRSVGDPAHDEYGVDHSGADRLARLGNQSLGPGAAVTRNRTQARLEAESGCE